MAEGPYLANNLNVDRRWLKVTCRISELKAGDERPLSCGGNSWRPCQQSASWRAPAWGPYLANNLWVDERQFKYLTVLTICESTDNVRSPLTLPIICGSTDDVCRPFPCRQYVDRYVMAGAYFANWQSTAQRVTAVGTYLANNLRVDGWCLKAALSARTLEQLLLLILFASDRILKICLAQSNMADGRKMNRISFLATCRVDSSRDK